MAEQVENKQKNQNKKSDWMSDASDFGGELLKLAFSGLVLGVSSSFGSRLISGASAPQKSVRLTEGGDTVIPLRKLG